MGFPTPLRAWFRQDATAPLLNGLTAKNSWLAEYIHLPVLEELVSQHRQGLQDATDRIWRLLNLQIWGDVFLTGQREKWLNREATGSLR